MRLVITRIVISLRILGSKSLQAALGLVTITAMHSQNAMVEIAPELCSARPRTGESNATFGCTEATTPAWQCFHVHSINASVGPSPDEATTATWRYQRNQQFSITAVTTSSGSVAERYAYTAYGQPTILDGSGSVLSSSAINNRYTYTGREWDQTLGLYHFRARWMSGLAGRFMGRHPIGYLAGWNLCSYVNNKPLRYVDPYGNADWVPGMHGAPLIRLSGENPASWRVPPGADCREVLDAIDDAETSIINRAIDNGEQMQLRRQQRALMVDLGYPQSIIDEFDDATDRKYIQHIHRLQEERSWLARLKAFRGRMKCCGIVGIAVGIALAGPEVVTAGQTGGVGAALSSATNNFIVEPATGIGTSVLVGGTVLGGTMITGTTVATGGGVALVGVGGAATIGGGVTIAFGGGMAVGHAIGGINANGNSIHGHFGDGLVYICPGCWGW